MLIDVIVSRRAGLLGSLFLFTILVCHDTAIAAEDGVANQQARSTAWDIPRGSVRNFGQTRGEVGGSHSLRSQAPRSS